MINLHSFILDYRQQSWPKVAILIHIALLTVFALTRLIDYDEGFYLMAAQRVAEGRTPYLDFFYPQMPLLPYLLAPLSGFGFLTLFVSRLLGVFLSVLTLLLFYNIVKNLTNNYAVRTVIVFLYVFSGLIITWHPTAKTYPWVDLLLLASFYYIIHYFKTNKLTDVIKVGVCLAFAINIRLVFTPLVILFGLALLVSTDRLKIRTMILYLLPLLVISLPSLYLLTADPDRFFFSNFGYHLVRSYWVKFPQSFYWRAETIGKLLINPQMAIILTIAGIALYYRKVKSKGQFWKVSLKSPTDLAAMTAMLITIIYLLPHPILQQYFVQALPFVFLASGRGIEDVFHHVSRLKVGSPYKHILPLVLLIYLVGILPYGIVFIGGIRYGDGSNTINNMRNLCVYLQENTSHEPILSEVPIIPVLSNVPGIDGLEYVGFAIPLPIDNNRRRHYHLPNNEDLIFLIKHDPPEFIIVKDSPSDSLLPFINAGYRPDSSFMRYHVYRRK